MTDGIEAVKTARKNLDQTQALEGVINIPGGAASEIGGNEGGDKASELLKDDNSGQQTTDKNNN